MTACLTGCTSFGAHKPGCDEEECRGCVPREASEGGLCGRCWGNLQRDIRTAPSIVDWIREHVEPSSQWGERINSGDVDAPAPLSVTAVADADELHACLASWALLILEEHPARLVGPRVERQWRADDGAVVGIKSTRISTAEDEPDRSAPPLGVAPYRRPLLSPLPGVRCPRSDLLVSQCGCGWHRRSA